METFPAFIAQVIPGIPLCLLSQLIEGGLLHITRTHCGLLVSEDNDQLETRIRLRVDKDKPKGWFKGN